MSCALSAGKLAAAVFAVALAAWSLSFGLESSHVHEGGEAVFAHRHVHAGHHRHAELPDVPDREEDAERESRPGTISSFESGTLLPPEATAVAPDRRTASGPGRAASRRLPRSEQRVSGGPRAPPR